jgi:Dynamin family
VATRERAREAFGTALRAVGDDAGLADLRQLLADAESHLDEPMRVAVIGHIKAGKSTFVNALLGEELAEVGTEELTFNVNRIGYGAPVSIVHFRDGRPPMTVPRGDAAAIVAGRRAREAAIDHVEVRDPNEILRAFEIIDTPGLRSQLATDSENTLAYLGMADGADADTREASAGADAIVCLFGRSLAGSDEAMVSAFQGDLLGAATPINAIGLLTKADVYWNYRDPDRDPLAEARTVIESLTADPSVRRVFYSILPIAGLVGFGARTLQPEDIEALHGLAVVAPEVLARRLRDASGFAAADLAVPSDARRRLIEQRLGQFGIWLGTQLLRDGGTAEEVREELWRRSGMAEVERLLRSHFGRRALLIKAQSGMRLALDASASAQRALQGDAVAAARTAGGALERWQGQEPAMGALELLRLYYRDPDALGLRNGESEELLRVTGERGTALALRLGEDESAEVSQLVARARCRLVHWRDVERGFGVTESTAVTARAMARVYEHLLHHAEAARRHLELDE